MIVGYLNLKGAAVFPNKAPSTGGWCGCCVGPGGRL